MQDNNLTVTGAKQLGDDIDVKQLIELVFVVGTYTALAMVFNSLGIQLDPDLDPASGPRVPPHDT